MGAASRNRYLAVVPEKYTIPKKDIIELLSAGPVPDVMDQFSYA
jgi:hypothetical protein